MKTLQTTVSVYSVYELSNDAKKSALNAWRSHTPYANQFDMLMTIKEFCKMFPVKLIDSMYLHDNIPYIQWQFTDDESLKELRGEELADYIFGKYGSVLFTSTGERNIAPLTGYFADYIILDRLYAFLQTGEDIEYVLLLDECIDLYARLVYKDMEEFYSMDSFIRECNERGYQFLENGRLF